MRNLMVLLLLLSAIAVSAINAHDRHQMWCVGSPPHHIVSTREPRACKDAAECLTTCEGGDGEACGFLGRFLDYAIADQNSSIRLSGWYHKLGCEAGWLPACRDYADWLDADILHGEHPEGNPLIYRIKACGKGADLRSCLALAETWGETSRTAAIKAPSNIYEKRSVETSRKTLQEADRVTPDEGWPAFVGTALSSGCQSGDGEACRLFTQLTASCANPDDPGCPLLRETVRMGMQDCENGDAIACLEIKNLLFSPMVDPDNAQSGKVSERAEQLFRDRCDAENDWVNCRNYFVAARQEYDKPEDLDEAEAPRLKSHLGREASFFNSLISTLCDRGELDSCLDLFDRQSSNDDMTASALEKLSEICGKGSADACLRVARIKLNPEFPFLDVAGSVALYTRQCGSGGCRELAVRYLQGTGLPANKELATDTLKLGCKSGDPESCHDLAHLDEWLSDGYVREDD